MVTHPLSLGFLAVTGKGGVGKSMVAAAVGGLAARNGRRVLICDLDASGDVAAAFGSPAQGYEPVSVAPGVDVMQMNTEAAIRDYLATFTPIPVVSRLGPVSRGLDLMGRAAPGVREVLSVGKLLWFVRQGTYDLVVMDGPATGHVVGHLAAPVSVGRLAAGGLLATQTSWMTDLLSDPTVAGALVVATPDDGPVDEALALVDRIPSATPIGLVGGVVNRMPAVPGLAADLRLLDYVEHAIAQGGSDSASPGLSAMVGHLVNLRDRGDRALGCFRRLAERLDPLICWSLPDLGGDPTLEALVEILEGEW